MSNSFVIRHQADPHADTSSPDPHEDMFAKNTLGFWIYLMSDCLIFTTLFATYAVLHNNTFGGPSSKDLFDLHTAFIETMLLLFSSVTCGMTLLSAVKNQKKHLLTWLTVTFALGASFIFMELREFTSLVEHGHSWTKSAFLSSFFTLVGTHGLHVSVGLLWLTVMFFQVLSKGLNASTFRRLVIFSLFWHFLDLVWIFIFTLVYLMGVI